MHCAYLRIGTAKHSKAFLKFPQRDSVNSDTCYFAQNPPEVMLWTLVIEPSALATSLSCPPSYGSVLVDYGSTATWHLVTSCPIPSWSRDCRKDSTSLEIGICRPRWPRLWSCSWIRTHPQPRDAMFCCFYDDDDCWWRWWRWRWWWSWWWWYQM